MKHLARILFLLTLYLVPLPIQAGTTQITSPAGLPRSSSNGPIAPAQPPPAIQTFTTPPIPIQDMSLQNFMAPSIPVNTTTPSGDSLQLRGITPPSDQTPSSTPAPTPSGEAPAQAPNQATTQVPAQAPAQTSPKVELQLAKKENSLEPSTVESFFQVNGLPKRLVALPAVPQGLLQQRTSNPNSLSAAGRGNPPPSTSIGKAGRALWHVLDNLGIPVYTGKESGLDPSLSRASSTSAQPTLQTPSQNPTGSEFPQKIPESELEGTSE